jgi:hypothetical protein
VQRPYKKWSPRSQKHRKNVQELKNSNDIAKDMTFLSKIIFYHALLEYSIIKSTMKRVFANVLNLLFIEPM